MLSTRGTLKSYPSDGHYPLLSHSPPTLRYPHLRTYPFFSHSTHPPRPHRPSISSPSFPPFSPPHPPSFITNPLLAILSLPRFYICTRTFLALFLFAFTLLAFFSLPRSLRTRLVSFPPPPRTLAFSSPINPLPYHPLTPTPMPYFTSYPSFLSVLASLCFSLSLSGIVFFLVSLDRPSWFAFLLYRSLALLRNPL